ncbi:hypothetical protein S40293_10009 [Stachybotrys chartarum IBT 40293]|nr:hypothetical protein S40293_10009 [Stachybotrys chartarum IBT 40293]
MGDFVVSTVCKDFVNTCWSGQPSMRAQYAALRSKGSHAEERESSRQRELYKAFVSPLKAIPKDLDHWISQWEMRVSLAKQAKVTELQDAGRWSSDLIDAIKGVLPDLSGLLKMVYGQRFNNNTITCEEIVAAMKDWKSSQNMTLKRKAPQYGAFHRGLDDQEEDNAAAFPSLETPDNKKQSRGYRGRGGGRGGNNHRSRGGRREEQRHIPPNQQREQDYGEPKRQRTDQQYGSPPGSIRACIYCCAFHPFPCFYVFPDQAHHTHHEWRPYVPTQEKIMKQLEWDPQWKKQYEEDKKKL